MVDHSTPGGHLRSPETVGPPFDAAPMARLVLSICGPGRILDVSSGAGELVRELLKQGADAYGVSTSAAAVARCNRHAPGRFLAGSTLALPFRNDSFDTLISTDCLAPEDAAQSLQELHRVCRRYVFLRVTVNPSRDRLGRPAAQPRDWWENAAFAAGFRKHPAYYTVNPFEALERDADIIAIPLEKIPDATLVRYPLQDLMLERALHMDMSRETGPRSDAHMARYALAAEWVRPSDTVLDCACGLGYGTAMLAALSRGKRFLGVDIGDRAVAYARDNFGDRYRVEYRQGDAEDLSFLPDASVDTLVSFETLEHVPGFERFLAEARRILKPDGRIVVSVPNRWEDETGRDPNPYHYHVFDYARVCAALEAQGFIVEARYAQSAPGGFKLAGARRALERLPLRPEAAEKDTEWWIVVASANPLDGAGKPYSHPDFGRSATGANFHVADFARHYHNPWLYRSLVQMGERLGDPGPLLELAREIVASASRVSADYGAALAVIGYHVLSDKEAGADEVDALLGLADAYLAQPEGNNPHVLRWKISLAFLSALLALKKGDRSAALRYFTVAAEADPCDFSPLLATKTVAARFWSGVLHLVDGDGEAARRCFAAGVEAGRRALHAPDENAIGNPLDPLTFGFPELAEVADMAGQCANALHYLDDFERAPGKVWRAVDLRRFGLATWATGLEAELKRVRAMDEKHRGAIDALWRESSPWARLVNRTLEKLFGVRLVRTRAFQRLRADGE
jgi:SAM-dependent methyltransferase